MPGRLHVVATPIGNLADLSPRAAELLRSVDLVLAEDTRRTGRLLKHLDSQVAQRSLHDHNERERIDQTLRALDDGAQIALVSDAGTPVVSDPGYRLVAAVIEGGHEVVALPGPSALLAALAVSGLPSDRVAFEGFLPRRGKARRDRLAELATEPRTMVLFVSPHRVATDLSDLADALGGTRVAVLARELTKLHEQVLRGSLAELADLAREGLRGEMTLVLAGAPDDEVDTEVAPSALADRVRELIATGQSKKEAIAAVAAASRRPKREVYQAVLDEGEG